MKIKTITCIAAALLCYAQTNAQTASQKITVKQNPKQIVAQRVTEPIKIDGLITDNAWKTAPPLWAIPSFAPHLLKQKTRQTEPKYICFIMMKGFILEAIVTKEQKTAFQKN
jgi:hypothetical protein